LYVSETLSFEFISVSHSQKLCRAEKDFFKANNSSEIEFEFFQINNIPIICKSPSVCFNNKSVHIKFDSKHSKLTRRDLIVR